MAMQRTCELLFIGMFVLNGWCQSPQPPSNAPQRNRLFDGKWWLRADTEERSGFINGAVDCLTWTARKKGFNATPEQVADKISKFYKAHPEAASLTVVDVWEKLAPRPMPTKTPEAQGETWKNAHWYLNGDWWGSISQLQEQGYLEGYLWCMDNRVVPKTDIYSNSVRYYQKKIDAYVEAHPKSGSEAVALILSRFCDKPNGGQADKGFKTESQRGK
ncbi:MAG TPA: hypothetical protein VMW38_11035 [Terriglobia bacterium]|nr:hypothetical protein [Terriglobia bacterium]